MYSSAITNISETEIAGLMRNFGKLYDYEIENLEDLNRLQHIIELYTNGLKDFNTWMNLLYDVCTLKNVQLIADEFISI